MEGDRWLIKGPIFQFYGPWGACEHSDLETQGGLEVDNHGMQLDKDCLWGSYMECKVCYQVIWIWN